TATTDADGRFTFAALPVGKTAFPSVYLVAVKNGFGPVIKLVQPEQAKSVDLTLPAAVAYGGAVKAGARRPVAGAEVQVGYVHRSVQATSRGGSWGYLPAAAVRGSP